MEIIGGLNASKRNKSMRFKLPESSCLDPFHKVEGSPKEARASFYELAKDRVKYLTHQEMLKWHEDVYGEKQLHTAAFVAAVFGPEEEKNIGKWITHLEIVVNKDAFNINGKDYSDLMPFVLEHEIYEAWLRGKRGVGPGLDESKRHLLAKRRQYLLAEKAGHGDKLFEWEMLVNPDRRKEYKYALKYAKKQLGRLKK